MHQLTRVEAEAAAYMDEESRYALRDQKTKLDKEFGDMLGKIGKRGNILNIPTMKLKQINNNNDLKREIGIYKKFLIDMDHDKSLGSEGNSDLMNIRDEILASMNKFLYLLTLH